MRLRETVEIVAAPREVWPFIVDPVLQAGWNPKVISVDRATDGPVALGERFQMIYRMSSKDQLSNVEVIELVPDERLTMRHTVSAHGAEHTVTEAYDLRASGDSTRLTQTLDLSQTGLPWPIRLLIGFITRFGKPVNTPYLDRLKAMIESDLGSN